MQRSVANGDERRPHRPVWVAHGLLSGVVCPTSLRSRSNSKSSRWEAERATSAPGVEALSRRSETRHTQRHTTSARPASPCGWRRARRPEPERSERVSVYWKVSALVGRRMTLDSFADRPVGASSSGEKGPESNEMGATNSPSGVAGCRPRPLGPGAYVSGVGWPTLAFVAAGRPRDRLSHTYHPLPPGPERGGPRLCRRAAPEPMRRQPLRRGRRGALPGLRELDRSDPGDLVAHATPADGHVSFAKDKM